MHKYFFHRTFELNTLKSYKMTLKYNSQTRAVNYSDFSIDLEYFNVSPKYIHDEYFIQKELMYNMCIYSAKHKTIKYRI